MNETFITQQVEQYKKNISMQSHNKTLLRYTGLPVVKEERLFFTLLPLLNGEDWNESMYDLINRSVPNFFFAGCS